MTEKSYGGNSSVPKPKSFSKAKQIGISNISTAKEELEAERFHVTKEEKEKLIKAGEISKKVKTFAREFIKKDMLLKEIAEKIDSKIIELGGKPAFPVNLSINEIAAHSTPSHNDETKAQGLLKVDIGVHVDGYVADTAFSLDLEKNEENKKLIEAAEFALQKALSRISHGTELREIGQEVQEAIFSYGFQPIRNLSGHSIIQYELHAGVTIPNHDNGQEIPIEEGVYAIEPFATSGAGQVIDGKPSGIYAVEREGQVRDMFAREVLQFIKKEYQTLPFCSRWLVQKFGTRSLIALKRLEEAKILHQYSQLVEKQRKPVAQAEHTIIITEKDKIITT